MTLNEQIAEIIAGGTVVPLYDTTDLRKQLSEDHQKCWEQYIDPLEFFPAGGLWLSLQDWRAGRTLAHPTNVARLLDAGEEGDPELIQ